MSLHNRNSQICLPEKGVAPSEEKRPAVMYLHSKPSLVSRKIYDVDEKKLVSVNHDIFGCPERTIFYQEPSGVSSRQEVCMKRALVKT